MCLSNSIQLFILINLYLLSFTRI